MRSLLYFFSLTFLISWSLFLSAAMVSRNVSLPGAPFSILGHIIYLAGVFAPAFVAIFLSWREKRKAGIMALLGKMIKPANDWRLYAFAAGYLLIIKLIAALIYRIAIDKWPSFGQEPFFLIIIAIIFSTPVQAGEEVGWRGFALPRLADRFGLSFASIILGIIWATWHLPFFFLLNADKSGQSFPVYLLSVTALSVPIAWLYWRTHGSLLLTMLMHAAINNTSGIVPSASPGATNVFSLNASPVAWITTAILCVFAVYFLRQMRNEKKETT